MRFFLPLFLFLFFAFSSCASVDVEKTVRAKAESGRQDSTGTGTLPVIPVPFEAEPPPPREVIIEKPIYVPEGEEAPPPPEGREAVEAANRGIIGPKDYENAAMLYDYHRDFVYELYCRPLRVSDITLEAGERAAEAPFISDSERWILGAGVSYESGVAVQHIYVKPTEASLNATLIINTNLRVYHLILRSYSDIHMPIVRWRYHDTAVPENYIKENGVTGNFDGEDEDGVYVDPRFLSFNYSIIYSRFRKPSWLPSLVYDDGKKTYITFPETALQAEFPTVFENRSDIVNYRVKRNVVIIDKLIQKIVIRLGSTRVTVEKKER